MSFISEFKDFAIKGNMIDMAVGIVVGGAFGKVVASFVEDVIMPPIGLLLGGVDFSSLGVVLKEAAEGAEAVVLRYGSFIQSIVNFLIIALAIFIVVKWINSLKKAEEEKPAEPPADEVLLTEIRDLLKK